jgi:hypothetical protein
MQNEKLNFRCVFSFLFNEKNDLETIRYSSGIDLEISDKAKKEYQSPNNISNLVNKGGQNYTIFQSLKGRTDLILLINSLKRGIPIKKFLKSYFKVKEDLMDIITYNGKKRVVILLKSKNIKNLKIFPFLEKFWIQNSQQLISTWHKIH